jgi:hypothetical protein
MGVQRRKASRARQGCSTHSCRNEDAASSYAYTPPCMSPTMAVVVNPALSFLLTLLAITYMLTHWGPEDRNRRTRIDPSGVHHEQPSRNTLDAILSSRLNSIRLSDE